MGNFIGTKIYFKDFMPYHSTKMRGNYKGKNTSASNTSKCF